MRYEYQGLQFPNKKELREHFNLSTCKFEAKLKDKEIIKITQQAPANEKLHSDAKQYK